MKTSTLDTQRARGPQDISYTELLRTSDPPARLRIRIKRDTYDSQSYAVIELHDGRLWQELACILQPQIATKDTGGILTDAVFAADRNRLLEMAGKILGDV